MVWGLGFVLGLGVRVGLGFRLGVWVEIRVIVRENQFQKRIVEEAKE